MIYSLTLLNVASLEIQFQAQQGKINVNIKLVFSVLYIFSFFPSAYYVYIRVQLGYLVLMVIEMSQIIVEPFQLT